MSGAFAPAATGTSVRPAISTMRRALVSVSSSGTFPATGVMASIFNSGERMASSSTNASSTPGSVSMMTRKGSPAGCSGSATMACARRVKALAANPAAEVVTNWRRVMGKDLPSEFIWLPWFSGKRRKLSALDNRNVGAPSNFQQPERFLFHPLVAADGSDAQDVESIRLEKDQNRLHVGRSRPTRILIHDHFNLLAVQVIRRRHQH